MNPGPDRYARALTAGLRSGALWYATVTLVMAYAAMAEARLPSDGLRSVLLPAAGSALAIAAGLLLGLRMSRQMRRPVAVGCFLLMELGFTLSLVAQSQGLAFGSTTASFSLSLFKTALIAYSVNAGRRWAPTVMSAAVVVTTEAICLVLGPRLGYTWAFDGAALAAFGIVVLASIGFALARHRAEAPRRLFARAADEDALLHTRAIARSRAAAVVHDTVLNDLAVLATTEPGAVPPALTARLRATLTLLASADWTAETPGASGGGDGPIERAVARAADAGLQVRVEGEVEALGALTPAARRALEGAVDQCLTNILRHAGTDAAEVTVLAESADVSVMITDDGTGFDADAVPDDRMGLAASVRARVEDEGGSVRIFARPGVGTTVLLTMPRESAGLIGSDA